jgi:Mlc titration factor MtfA (ptsG expression regulator)
MVFLELLGGCSNFLPKQAAEGHFGAWQSGLVAAVEEVKEWLDRQTSELVSLNAWESQGDSGLVGLEPRERYDGGSQ